VIVEEYEDQLGWSCEKWSSVAREKWGKEYRAYNEKEKATWIGHILRRNCFLKYLIEGKLKGKREDMERGVIRLFDDLKEKRGY